jgi:hypothetical protein
MLNRGYAYTTIIISKDHGRTLLSHLEKPETDGTFTNFHLPKNWKRSVCPQFFRNHAFQLAGES